MSTDIYKGPFHVRKASQQNLDEQKTSTRAMQARLFVSGPTALQGGIRVRQGHAWVDATRVVTVPGTMHGCDTSSAVFSSSTMRLRKQPHISQAWCGSLVAQRRRLVLWRLGCISSRRYSQADAMACASGTVKMSG